MTDLSADRRRAYCECAKNVLISKIEDEDLKKYLSKEIDFNALMPDIEGLYDECEWR